MIEIYSAMCQKIPQRAVELQEHYPHKKFENYKVSYAHALWPNFRTSKYQLYLLHTQKKYLNVYMVAFIALFIILKK